MTVFTTLIASWVKKKGFVKRIQDVDKRIARLEKFLGKLDYQIRLVPLDKREDYAKFVEDNREEYTELSIYSSLLSPAEFTYTVYMITRFHTPIVRETWPWYNTITKRPRKNFARDLIKTYESQYSWNAWLKATICCGWNNIDEYNPLLKEDQVETLFWLSDDERLNYLSKKTAAQRAEIFATINTFDPSGGEKMSKQYWEYIKMKNDPSTSIPAARFQHVNVRRGSNKYKYPKSPGYISPSSRKDSGFKIDVSDYDNNDYDNNDDDDSPTADSCWRRR